MPGISLNIDCTHYFHTRGPEAMTREAVIEFLDMYSGTAVSELIFNVNGQRTSFASQAWTPRWEGYDPEGGTGQPYFRSVPEDRRAEVDKYVGNMFLLHRRGVDPFACWIAKCRQMGVSPWLSMRMGDMHNAANLEHCGHHEMYRSRDDLRRVTYRPFAIANDRALDYAQPEVYDYHMRLVREMAERYDPDGLELDWSRHFAYLRPGRELADSTVMTKFVADAKRAARSAGERLGHEVRLGVRVPATPRTARWLGLDAVQWAREGLVDYVVPAPLWYTIDFGMPIAEWKELLAGTQAMLGAGLERHAQAFPRGRREQPASVEVVRGAAAAFLRQGADRVYLFNYFDSDTRSLGKRLYNAGSTGFLREIGSLDAMAGKPRRHLITYQDVLAPGEAPANQLPLAVSGLGQLRVDIGPKPDGGSALALFAASWPDDASKSVTLFVNGHRGEDKGLTERDPPCPETPLRCFQIPAECLNDGYNLVEILCGEPLVVTWMEIDIHQSF